MQFLLNFISDLGVFSMFSSTTPLTIKFDGSLMVWHHPFVFLSLLIPYLYSWFTTKVVDTFSLYSLNSRPKKITRFFWLFKLLTLPFIKGLKFCWEIFQVVMSIEIFSFLISHYWFSIFMFLIYFFTSVGEYMLCMLPMTAMCFESAVSGSSTGWDNMQKMPEPSIDYYFNNERFSNYWLGSFLTSKSWTKEGGPISNVFPVGTYMLFEPQIPYGDLGPWESFKDFTKGMVKDMNGLIVNNSFYMKYNPASGMTFPLNAHSYYIPCDIPGVGYKPAGYCSWWSKSCVYLSNDMLTGLGTLNIETLNLNNRYSNFQMELLNSNNTLWKDFAKEPYNYIIHLEDNGESKLWKMTQKWSCFCIKSSSETGLYKEFYPIMPPSPSARPDLWEALSAENVLSGLSRLNLR